MRFAAAAALPGKKGGGGSSEAMVFPMVPVASYPGGNVMTTAHQLGNGNGAGYAAATYPLAGVAPQPLINPSPNTIPPISMPGQPNVPVQRPSPPVVPASLVRSPFQVPAAPQQAAGIGSAPPLQSTQFAHLLAPPSPPTVSFAPPPPPASHTIDSPDVLPETMPPTSPTDARYGIRGYATQADAGSAPDNIAARNMAGVVLPKDFSGNSMQPSVAIH